MPDWDDVHLFLAVARSGRLVAAGKAVGVDHTTIARRLGALEAALDVRLFDRSPRGVTLTEAGRLLLPHAERMESEMEAAVARLGPRGAAPSGVVRIATPEAFGMAIVAPHVAEFHRRYPDLRLDLAPEPRQVSLANHEADIAIVLNRPPKGRVFARRLVDFRLCLYSSADYLAEHGPVASRAELRRHPFVWYMDEKIDDPELLYLNEVIPDARPVFRSTSISAQQGAVAAGLGLGLLHAFAAEADARLVRVLPEVEVKRSYWLVFHVDHQHQPRVRAVVEFLDELIERYRPQF
ncbi:MULTISPECIES: LysR family transcriptional regulator [Nitrospirillum]|uniref:LysR family transcriptional regulator n=1 Tax=Nitrospirillum amazonense TaxID=28077 RepID=A0A560GDY3_9PROT|nr:LysR family transcriptional regulator [Nitrospirillum amazonense]MEC4590975.1 LysR family transcriptional regulator [Nitrospirillum amazonense]TWB32112.1 LysR family transcriptional regulator [Nitrospirillum amazonense]